VAPVSGGDLRRRLAAILAADAVGYSRLMSLDERATVNALDAARRVFRSYIESNQGRVVDMAGDSVLAVFETATGAVNAALMIQADLNPVAGAAPEDRRMRFRIGVHLGDVIEKADGTVYGDGVNIAARLEGLAEPGGVTVSVSIHTAVLGKIAATFIDQGEQHVKNIAHPVRAYRVQVGEAEAAMPGSRPSGSAAENELSLPDKPSIAVLPFTNMSGDPEQEHLTDGIAEDIITALSRFREIVVISRGSSFAFKGKGLDDQRIALQLRVRYLLSGSIRRAGNRVRVSAELTDTGSRVQVWADRYDRDLADIFELQDDISRTVAAVVAPAVQGAEIDRARRKPPANLSAHDLYLRALPHLWAVTREDNPKAMELLQLSVSLDPSSAPALAALAMCMVLAPFVGAPTTLEMATESRKLALRAIEQDGADAFAQATCGFTLAFGPSREYDQGLLHAREAVRLNPSSAFGWGTMGMINSLAGDCEAAMEELHRAHDLSPFDNMLFLWSAALASACFALARSQEGAVWARKAIQQNPGHGTAHRLLAANLALAGRVEEASDVNRRRDSVQRTTVGELRAIHMFRQEEVHERYMAAQRLAGLSE
jgi:TolB-like protein/class 3 adenylate cyclase